MNKKKLLRIKTTTDVASVNSKNKNYMSGLYYIHTFVCMDMYVPMCGRIFCIIFIFVIIKLGFLPFCYIPESRDLSKLSIHQNKFKATQKKEDNQPLPFNISNKRIKLKSLNHILKHYLISLLLSMGALLIVSLLTTRDSCLLH